MKSWFTRFGFIIILVSLVFFKMKWELYEVERRGDIVLMKISKLPKTCNFTKGNYFMDLDFNNEIYNKKIPPGFCNEHRVGEFIQMKHLKGEESVLFINESVIGEFISIGIFIIVGFFSILTGRYDRRNFK